MNTITLIPSNAVFCVDGQPKTDSLKVAAAFGKRHNDVSRKIQAMECSEEFRSAHFSAHPFTNEQNGETYTKWAMDFSGFMFLVMGFTGKKAAAVKEAFINKFNELADQAAGLSLSRQLPVQPTHKVKLTDLIYELAELRGCTANDVRLHYRQVFNNPVWPEGGEFATALARAALKSDIRNLRKAHSPSVKQLKDEAAQQGFTLVSEAELALMRQLLQENMKKIEAMEKELVSVARTNQRLMQAGLFG